MLRLRLSVTLLAALVMVSCTQKERVSYSESTAVSSTVSSSAAPATTSSSMSSTSSVATATTATTVTTGSGPAAAATAAAAVTDTGIASTEGEQSGVTAVVKELKRASGGTVTLKFSIVNNSPKKLGFGYDFADPSHEIRDHGTVGGVQLIDPVGKKKYFVARDAEDHSICSQKIADIAPGKSTNLWAKFPAPPEDVQKISVVIPHFAPLDDVPISN